MWDTLGSRDSTGSSLNCGATSCLPVARADSATPANGFPFVKSPLAATLCKPVDELPIERFNFAGGFKNGHHRPSRLAGHRGGEPSVNESRSTDSKQSRALGESRCVGTSACDAKLAPARYPIYRNLLLALVGVVFRLSVLYLVVLTPVLLLSQSLRDGATSKQGTSAWASSTGLRLTGAPHFSPSICFSIVGYRAS